MKKDGTRNIFDKIMEYTEQDRWSGVLIKCENEMLNET